MIARWLGGAVLALSLAMHPASGASTEPGGGPPPVTPEVEVATAPVEIDGRVVFRVRGFSLLPAERRAAAVRDRIVALARDPTFRPETLRIAADETYLAIMAGDQRVIAIVDGDARLDQVRPRELAQAMLERIQAAIVDHRRLRTPAALLRGLLFAAGATAALAVAILVVVRLGRRLEAVISRRVSARVRALESQSHEILKAESVLGTLRTALRGIRFAALAVAVLAYCQFVMSLFPWTRGHAARFLDLVTDPLEAMGSAVVANIPNLVFLAVLVTVVRLALRLMRLFFDSVAQGTVTLRGFEADWARPTYKITRFAVVAFSAVVAYPYIPGSGTAAFQGISLFIGVVFSLGSSSVIANVIAGYTMTYRRAFKVGDRVKIGEVVGDVLEIRPQVTRLRSLKNEEAVVPNSLILNSQVINYSSLAARDGLILHTTVGIGYETPWRQVEAMLLLAAGRTGGLEREPPPFVLQRRLADFAVEYELNVYSRDPRRMGALYTALHRSILDVFNQYGVQIMTPAYEADPPQPKLVARDQWHAAPAERDGVGLPESRPPEEPAP